MVIYKLDTTIHSPQLDLKMSRVSLKNTVARQLPEFIREDYPTFVAFVEAYYEYLQAQDVDLTQLRDIDTTLTSFVEYFKKELAVNLPVIVEDERLLLQKVKDLYLSKGSEGSFKLLFRLLFGKNVELTYPGTTMLRTSDGRWNQEISVFVQVEYGNPSDLVGRLVDIVSGDRIIRVLVDRKEELIGEVERIVDLGGNIYEIFLDKRFFGTISAGDRIKYGNTFQGQILPATTYLRITQPGKNFRVGQVFELQSGGGTGALVKVTQVLPGGGMKTGELIKFGIGYTTSFALSILASNTVTAKEVPLTSSSARNGENLILGDTVPGMGELGYINLADYVTETYVDGAYAGSIIREFSLNAKNINIDSLEPAVLEITLGALNRYPGYFETNNGFPSDSIYIQDSKYYQAFSYVLRIDERLASYKSAVKSMVHPAGMKLFAEYNITNSFNLGVALESLVKSLGIGVNDTIDNITDFSTLSISKSLSDAQSSISDGVFYLSSTKGLADATVGTWSDDYTLAISKAVSSSVGPLDDVLTNSIDKSLEDLSVGTFSETFYLGDSADPTVGFGKTLDDAVIPTEVLAVEMDKYLYTAETPDVLPEQDHQGYIQLNSYSAMDYVVYADEYSVGSRESTFSTL
jgi:hypothetical protein